MGATAFPAAAIVSGTIATPRLGSGTADATSFLRGDSTWAVVPEVTRASLGLATTDSPTFAGATFSGALQAATIEGATTLSLKTAGATRADYNITTTASWTFVSSAFIVGSNVRIPETNFFFWKSRSVIASPADGQIQFLTQNGSNFSALILGPATASFPSIRRNGTAINFRLADDSADAPITASNALFYKTNTSATSYEALQIDATGDASNFDIAASIGSAGGTARGIRIGGKDAAGTFTSWLSFSTAGAASLPTSGSLNFGSNHRIYGGNDGFCYFTAFGANVAGWTSGRLEFAATSRISLLSISNSAFVGSIRGCTTAREGVSILSASSTTVFGTLEAGTIDNPTGTLSIGNASRATGFLGSSATFSGTINPRTGTATAGTAPIKLTAGTNLTTPEAGAIEYDGTNLYFTDSGGTRRQLAVV